MAAAMILGRFLSFLVLADSIPIRALFDFMTEFLGESPDVYKPGDDYDEALKNMGVREFVRDGMLDPEFDAIRLTNSARGWAVETIEDGWIFLTSLDSTIKRNEKKIKDYLFAGGPGARAARRSKMKSEADGRGGSSADSAATAGSSGS